MKTPISAFLEWFDALPAPLGRFLAHFYRISTTADATDMTMTPDESHAQFMNYVVVGDFPLRVAARMVMIRAVFDFAFMTRDTLVSQPGAPPFDSGSHDNVVPLSVKQWENAFDSWKRLRSMEMSDSYLFSWARFVVGEKR